MVPRLTVPHNEFSIFRGYGSALSRYLLNFPDEDFALRRYALKLEHNVLPSVKT
jgi:hypothetical protein